MNLSIPMVVLGAVAVCGCASQPPPVIVQQAPPPKKAVIIPDDPMAGLSPDVQAALKSGNTQPLHDGIAVNYVYSPHVEWRVNCAPMHATEIQLAPDETTSKDEVMLGDRNRWDTRVSPLAVLVEPKGDFGGYVDPVSQQRVPPDPHMITTLTIVTSARRSYHFLLRMSKQNTGVVEFRYPDDVKRQQAAREAALKVQAKEESN